MYTVEYAAGQKLSLRQLKTPCVRRGRQIPLVASIHSTGSALSGGPDTSHEQTSRNYKEASRLLAYDAWFSKLCTSNTNATPDSPCLVRSLLGFLCPLCTTPLPHPGARRRVR